MPIEFHAGENLPSGDDAEPGSSPRPSGRVHARGFAAMDPQHQRQIASEGGRAAHASGKAHEFDVEEARTAGRKGGETVSRNREHMAIIGARGGRARRGSGQSSQDG